MLLSQEQKTSFPYQEKILSPRRTDERQPTMHLTRTTLKNRQELISFLNEKFSFFTCFEKAIFGTTNVCRFYTLYYLESFFCIFFFNLVSRYLSTIALFPQEKKFFDFILLFILTRLGSGCSQTSVPLNLVENKERCSDARAKSKTLCYVQQ